MRKQFALLALAVALAPFVSAQATVPFSTALLPRYQANFTTSGAGKVTVQATTTSGPVSFEEADVYCAAAQTVTFYTNGTAATTTALTITGPIGVASGIPATAFSASNVGTGTTLKSFTLAAGQTLAWELGEFYLPAGAGTGANFTVGTSGTCTIQIQWIAQ